MASLSERQKDFLDQPYVATVTTLRKDGSPHTTVVWIDQQQGQVLFNTARGRAKARHLEQDPRVSITVVDPGDPYRWLSVSGRAELSDEGADAHIDRLAKKYLGQDSYPGRKEGEVRVIVRVTPELVGAAGLD